MNKRTRGHHGDPASSCLLCDNDLSPTDPPGALCRQCLLGYGYSYGLSGYGGQLTGEARRYGRAAEGDDEGAWERRGAWDNGVRALEGD